MAKRQPPIGSLFRTNINKHNYQKSFGGYAFLCIFVLIKINKMNTYLNTINSIEDTYSQYDFNYNANLI